LASLFNQGLIGIELKMSLQDMDAPKGIPTREPLGRISHAGPGFSGRRQKNPISALSIWKIFDNLRRSLVPPALALLLLPGWADSLRMGTNM
jgi:hypothetical protein